MKILITGGAGFIGSHLSERLVAEGHSVTALDDLSTGRRENLAGLVGSNRFRLVVGTILDPSLVQSLVDEADTVFHLAAAVGVKLIMDEPSRSILTNINGTENVLKAALKDRKLNFVASTSEVYGKAMKFPFSEDDDLTIGATKNLRWSYASAKQLDEFLTLAYVREATPPGRARPGATGWCCRTSCKRLSTAAPFWCTARESSRAVEALVRLMATPAAQGEVFNVANDQEVTIRELAEKVIEMTGSPSPIRLVPYSDVYPAGFEDMARRLPDVSKLERTIGFRPHRPLSEIIGDIIAEKRGLQPA